MNPLPRLDALHYLFTKKQESFVAHCLDLDLVAVGKDRAVAEQRLNAIVRAQISAAYSAGNYTVLFFHAPPEFWQAMQHAQNLPSSLLTVETEPPMVLPVKNKMMQVDLPVFRALSAA